MKLPNELQVVKSNQSTPVLQCHGDADPLVTYDFGKMASELVGTFNNHLQFKSYRGLAHSYCYQVLLSFLSSASASLNPTVVYKCFVILYIIFPKVCLYALTLYPATDGAAVTDVSGVSGR